jgi:hypothetical protein
MARQANVEFIEEDDESPKHAKPTRRVKVLSPFQVVYETVVYPPGAVASVPESLADEWIRAQWVSAE